MKSRRHFIVPERLISVRYFVFFWKVSKNVELVARRVGPRTGDARNAKFSFSNTGGGRSAHGAKLLKLTKFKLV
ncbi:MAG TPA: hypothetical protein VFV50_03785, partial [Bdellovibrionales bacterium]|nr:hypothetical protein [Bdellovibrionales bacterium]